MIADENLIGKFKMGVVVKFQGLFDNEFIYGHVVGFGLNLANEVTIKIQTPDDTRFLHPAYVFVVEF